MKQLKMKQKNKQVDFSVSYQVHQVLVYQEIYEQVKAQSELMKSNQSWPRLLMLPHPLITFEIQKYSQKDLKFNSVCSINNLPKINDGVYAIDLDEFKSIGTHQIALYMNDINLIYFDSLGVERIPK